MQWAPGAGRRYIKATWTLGQKELVNGLVYKSLSRQLDMPRFPRSRSSDPSKGSLVCRPPRQSSMRGRCETQRPHLCSVAIREPYNFLLKRVCSVSLNSLCQRCALHWLAALRHTRGSCILVTPGGITSEASWDLWDEGHHMNSELLPLARAKGAGVDLGNQFWLQNGLLFLCIDLLERG